MNISLIKQNNPLDNIELVEEVDKTKLKNLLDNFDKINLFSNQQDLENKKKILLRYFKKIKNNKISVQYLRKMKYARTYAKSSLSLQNMKKEIRHYLSIDNYVDIDIVNCHFVILYNILKHNNYLSLCPILENYVKNRNTIINKLMKELNKNKEDIKQIIISILYGSKLTYNNIFLEDFRKQIEIISNIIYDSNKELEKEIIRDRQKDYERMNKFEDNKKGILLSYFLQEYENNILYHAYEYITTNISNENKKHLVLCFDGIMVKKEEDIDLLELNKYIYDKTGFELEFIEKPMNDIITDKLKDFVNSIEDINEENLKYFDMKFCDSLINYQSKKYYFEHFFSKIMIPEPVFIFNDKKDSIDIQYKEEGLKKLLKPLKSGMLNESGKPINFVDYWLSDIEIKTFRKYDFLPFNEDIETKEIEEDVYNLFNGYDERTKTEYNKKLRDKLVKPFLVLALELCEGKQENLDYFLKYLSNMIKEPTRRPAIAFIMKSKQGEGKNTLLKAISNVIGQQYYFSTSKPSDFFGNHSELFVNKLLVNADECEGRDTVDYQGKMKAFISEDKISINPKNIRPYMASNYSRLIITTNKPNPINIDFNSKDRRYVCFQSTGKHLDKSSLWWSKLHKHFDRPDFISALYDYLMDIDYSNINWIKDRPLTNFYYEMKQNSTPQEYLFLEDFYNKCILEDIDMVEKEISYNKYFSDYNDWCEKYRIKNINNIKSFRMKMKEIYGITFFKKRNYLHINFDLLKIKTLFEENDNIEEEIKEEELDIFDI